MKKPLVVVVVGPTASGKTSLAIEIAKKYDGEIVSADSMQIYENMDIATAKPTEEEMAEVKHHLIGFIGCDEEYSVAMYKKDATEAIKRILSEGKLPVICGGTGLYIDTLIKNTTFFDYEKNDVRSELEKEADEKKKAEADARNEAEQTIFATEKSIKELVNRCMVKKV